MGDVLLPDAPAPVAGRRVFTSHDVVFTVADVARTGRVGDRAASVPDPAPGEVEIAFRRARGLLTADQLTAWLDAWAITPEDFVAWTEHSATGTRTATPWVSFVCSGGFDRAAADLAAAAAAACALGRPPATATDFDPDGWVERLVAASTTESSLRATVARRRLGWTRLTGSTVTAPSRAVCAELRLCLVADHVALTDAALRAGCPALPLDADLDDVDPPALRPYLAGARAGDIMGPVETPDGWTLVVLERRAEPDPRDPAVRSRAAALVGADAVARALARHIGT